MLIKNWQLDGKTDTYDDVKLKGSCPGMINLWQ
jgi:hypothetical protein